VAGTGTVVAGDESDHRTLTGMSESVAVASEPVLDQLIAAARCGDPRALGDLLTAVRNYLVAIAARRLPAGTAAHLAPSDIAQETALEIQRAFGGFTGSTAPELLAWIRSILVHNVSDAVRKSRSYDRVIATAAARSAATPDDDNAEMRRSPTAPPRPTEASAIRRDEARLVERVLATLSDDAREVVRLRYWEGLTFPDIGKRVGRSENAVRKAWYRAIARLQDEIHRSRREAQPPSRTRT